jgi:hypothetical protein
MFHQKPVWARNPPEVAPRYEVDMVLAEMLCRLCVLRNVHCGANCSEVGRTPSVVDLNH